jgi:hypothetical protein
MLATSIECIRSRKLTLMATVLQLASLPMNDVIINIPEAVYLRQIIYTELKYTYIEVGPRW